MLGQVNAAHCRLQHGTQAASERAQLRSLASIDTYSCPSPGNSISVTSGQTVRLQQADVGQLCTLTRVTDGTKSVPVGRSYDGHDWERVAGPYTSLQYSCDGSHCEVSIPDKLSDQEFHLTTFTANLPKRDEVARFLEQTTFGTKVKDLDDLGTELSQNTDLMPRFTDWLYDQIHETGPTSHRETFRRLTSPRMENAEKEGKQSNPCEVGATFRRASFTASDLRKNVHISKMDDRYALSVEGIIRTMVGELEFEGDTSFEYNSATSYQICNVGKGWSRDASFTIAFDVFGIKYNGICEKIKGG